MGTNGFPYRRARRNRAAALKFARSEERSRSLRREENSRESANNRPRNMRRIFLVSPAEQWLATLGLRRLDRCCFTFCELRREAVGVAVCADSLRSKAAKRRNTASNWHIRRLCHSSTNREIFVK